MVRTFFPLPPSPDFLSFILAVADMDMHEVRFEWPYTGPKTVIVTGTFDKWSSTRQLTKTATGFVCTTKVPWNQKILYKYIVDGKWALVHGRPVEVERETGFINHIYISPPKPQVVLPASKPEPDIADSTGAIVGTAEAPENADKNVDIPTRASPASGAEAATSPLTEEPAKEPAPIAAEVTPLDEHTKPAEPVHVDIGESSIADAKSDSGTTAVADPELTAEIMNAPLEPVPSQQHDETSPSKEPEPKAAAEKKMNRPSALPTTPTKGEAFPSVSPPSSPSRFGSLRGSGKKKRTPSFFARLKEVFKSDKEKDHSGKDKTETKN